MSESSSSVVAAAPFRLLLKVKMMEIRNRIAVAIANAPFRILASVLLLLLIWFGLFALFVLVFEQFKQTPLEATVAVPMVFNFFFVAMLALLTFSNSLIAYGMLFGQGDSRYLLVAPFTARQVVALKYLESLALSSWSLLVLGLPLMMAIGFSTHQNVVYPMFLAFFLAFIPIPGSLGMLVAWVAARYVPRYWVRRVLILLGVMLVVALLWGLRTLRLNDMGSEVWLRSFLDRMGFVETALLPNNWVARGIDHAIHGNVRVALGYLGVTVANAAFLSWLSVILVSRHFLTTFDSALASQGSGRRMATKPSGGFAGLLFAYLPMPLRLIAAKDLRTFLRDPMQWGQLVILFGLMMLYLLNMPAIQMDMSGSSWQLLIPFLNLCAVSLILATFTCRFVFPLVSLEGQKLWMIGLLPLPRNRILHAKFAFAMTVTLAVAILAMGVATYRLQLGWAWSLIHLAVTFAVCFGLCGFAVGIGARLPMFQHTNVARIANGLGGTTNLLASIALITVVLAFVGKATWESRYIAAEEIPGTRVLGFCILAISIGVGSGLFALEIGSRHFARAEI